MPWGKPAKGGWSTTGEREAATSFSQVIRTILEVVAGGVIRAGKTAWDDDAHVGFWLGVGGDGVARFAVGGPLWWLKFDGSEVLVMGRLSMRGGDTMGESVQMVGVDGATCAYLMGHDGWGHQVELGVPRQDSAGDPCMVDLFADGDFAASIRLRLCTERGAGPAGTKLQVLVGNTEAFRIDGAGNVWAAGNIVAGGTIHAEGGVV